MGLALIIWVLFGYIVQWSMIERNSPIDGGEWKPGWPHAFIRAVSWPVGLWVYRHRIWQCTKNRPQVL